MPRSSTSPARQRRRQGDLRRHRQLVDLDDGAKVTYQIVGEDEADIKQGMISISSPIARALIGGWRSRAVFKLQQIQQKDHLLRPGMVIVDLGAAPGGWSQYAAGILRGRGRVIALDVLPMEPIDGVEFIQGDFREDAVLQQLRDSLGGQRVDLVLSDMAPNISGIAAADQARRRSRPRFWSSSSSPRSRFCC
jgi:hypothetical protein